INVLFPTPGTPVIPTRTDLSAYGRQALMIAEAFSRWTGFVLSTSVIARLSAVMLPERIPLTSSSADCDLCRKVMMLRADDALMASGFWMPSFSLNAEGFFLWSGTVVRLTQS